jgi:hypothetical protein
VAVRKEKVRKGQDILLRHVHSDLLPPAPHIHKEENTQLQRGSTRTFVVRGTILLFDNCVSYTNPHKW